MPTLIIRSATGDVAHELDGNSVTIGRHPDNSLVIEDLSISTHHAAIIISDGTYVLRDLNSTNGTMLNGRPITEKELRREDIIKFGQVEAVYRITTQKPIDKKRTDKKEAQPSKPLPTFASKVANVGKPAFTESRRLAHMAALKATLTKAKHITLPACYYALGRKCYESRCFASVLSAEFKEIENLKELVQDYRRKVDVADHATALERFKGFAKNSVGVVTAEASALKFKSLFTHLGEKAALQEHAPEIADELDAVSNVKLQINSLETEYAAIAADHSAHEDLKTASSAITINAAIAFKQGWNGARRVLSHLKQRKLVFYATISISFIAVVYMGSIGLLMLFNHANKTESHIQTKQEIVQYLNTHPSQEGKIRRMKLGAMYGYVTVDGSIVIQPQFLYAGAFSDGIAKVWTKDGWGFISENGAFTDTTPNSSRRDEETELQLEAAKISTRTSDTELEHSIENIMSMDLGSFGRVGTPSRDEAQRTVLAALENFTYRLK